MMNDIYTDWKHWSSDQFGHCSRSDARYFQWCATKALPTIRPQSVLEIGFGNGAFLGYGRTQGWNIVGIETNGTLLDRAKAAGFVVHSDLQAIQSHDAFDLIAAFDVLEHLPIDEAQAMLTKLRSHLSPSGAILLRVPNGDSPFGRAYQHGDRTHVETYGSEKLRQLCITTGFRMTHSGEAPWNVQQGQARTLKTFVRAGLKKILDHLFGFAYFGYYTDLSPNLLVVIKPV